MDCCLGVQFITYKSLARFKEWKEKKVCKILSIKDIN